MPRHVAIATIGPGSLQKLAQATVGAGHRVTVMSDAKVAPRADVTSAAEIGQHATLDSVRHVTWNPADKVTTQRAVDEAMALHGEPDVLIVRTLPGAAAFGREVIAQDEAEWRDACGAAMLQTIHLLQCLAAPLRNRRAAIIFVGPSLSLVGAAGLAALVALLESQRGLVKSLARQWGKHGVTCNWIALDALELWPSFADYKLPRRLEAIPVALGRRPDAAADLAGLIEFLSGAAGRVMTGATLCLDGGEWMVP